MTTTPNLGLTIYNTASGSATTFLNFRLATAGLSSNFTILDAFLGDTSSSIITLKSNSVYLVNASIISTNYYEGTNSFITNYSTNMMINLKLNSTISGSASININSLGTKTLKKVDTTGTKMNLINNDLITGRYYLFIYDSTDFVLGGYDATSASAISNIYSGSPPIVVTGSVISLSISGSPPISFGGSVISLSTSGVTAGSGNQFIVDGFGRITSASYITSSGTTYTGSPPINIAGSIVSLTNTGTIWMPDAKPTSASALDDEFDNSSFTGWTNFDPYGDITIDEDVIGSTIQSNTGSAIFFGGIYKSFVINTSNVGTIWTKISNNNFATTQIGMMIGQNLAGSPSTSDIITFGFSTPDEQKTNIQFKSWASYSGSITIISSASCAFYNPTMYLRITYDLGLYYAYYSHDGLSWINVAYATSIPFNSLQVGLFGYTDDGTNIPVNFRSYFFRFSADTIPNLIMKGNRVKNIV